MLGSAYYSLEQDDPANALFYMNRAKPIAFGPLLDNFDTVTNYIEDSKNNEALVAMQELRDAWPTGDAENGATIYQEACAGCHGSEGQGGVGKKLKPNEFIQTNTNADIFAFVLVGREGTAMRGFNGILTEAQLADVISFLRTWQE
jgi:mono/diheme cytochrome c family protein